MSLLAVLVAVFPLTTAQSDAVPANEASWVVSKELPEGAKLRLGTGGFVLQHTRYGRSLAQISPDGRLLAVAIDPQVCVVRERVTGKELYRLKAPRTILDGNAFSILQFAPDSKTLAFGTTSRLQIVDAANGENRKTIPINGRIEFSLTFSGNGKRFTAPIITTRKKFRREIWDVATAKPLPITPAETDRRDPWRIVLSADGKTAALFSYSSKVEIGRIVVFWDVDADKDRTVEPWRRLARMRRS